MKFKKGERVKHPTKDDWGIGEVLTDSTEDAVRIFFVGAGEKTIALQYIQPLKVSGRESEHSVLDNLKISKSVSGIKYQSLPQSIQFFLEQFPEGFFGQRFHKEERDYKDKAHALALELLGKAAFTTLIENADFLETTKRALRVVNATNLIPNNPLEITGPHSWPKRCKPGSIAA